MPADATPDEPPKKMRWLRGEARATNPHNIESTENTMHGQPLLKALALAMPIILAAVSLAIGNTNPQPNGDIIGGDPINGDDIPI